MNTNDKLIKECKEKIATKRTELGAKPKLAYETSGVFNLDPSVSKLNVNLLRTSDQCVAYIAELLTVKNNSQQAADMLGVNCNCTIGAYTVDQCINDVILKHREIKWNDGQRELQDMDTQLSKLLSEEARTADVLASITSKLSQ